MTTTPFSSVLSKAHPLEGTWHNQLGSELRLIPDDTGSLRGWYKSATGTVSGMARPVQGAYDTEPPAADTVLGLLVEWPDVHTVTVWSGQYHAATDTISASWLMTVESSRDDAWRATFTGYDVFSR